MSRIYFISDLHVTGPEDPIYRSLLALLREKVGPGDTVVLGGDLFDLFVGGKGIFRDRYRAFLEALAECGGRGADIHYIEGNHDFLIHNAFGRIPGVQVHGQEIRLDLGERRFYVAHGDLADTSDYGYRALRGFFRSGLMKAFVRVMPGSVIDWIGRTSSDASRGRKPLLPAEMPIERRERLRKVFRSFAAARIAEGFDFVVLGHCHDLDEMKFQVEGRIGQYVNVGYPRAHGSMLLWEPGDTEIRRIPLP